MGCGSIADRSEIGDPLGVPLLSISYASKWHKDLSLSSSLVLLERDEATHWDFVRRCLTCQQVKVEHQKPARLLQPLEVAEWKREHITMDFCDPLTTGTMET